MTEPEETPGKLRDESDEREVRRASTDEGDPADVERLVREAQERSE